MKCKIVTGPRNYDFQDIFINDENQFIIGADQGAMILAENGVYFDIALGDFDSVDVSDMELINHYCNEIIKYPVKKDYTDTYLAVLEAFKRGYDEIVIYGGIGRRFDHTLANIALLKLGKIEIVSNNEKIYILEPGTFDVANEHKYISFFALENVKNLALSGFEYELDGADLDAFNPLCISNKKQGTLSFDEGLLLVIHQNE